MKLGLGLVVLLVLLAVAPAAWACKCRFATAQELEQGYLVFAGRAVEYLEREDDSAGERYPRVNAAVRFEVDRALRPGLGSAIVVGMDTETSCSTWFEVGQRHLVVAHDLGGPAYVTACPLLSDEVEQWVKRQLGLASDYFATSASQAASDFEACQRPATLEAAVQRASAVAWYSPVASCAMASGELVEHAALVIWGFKGLRRGEVVRLQAGPRARRLTQEAERVWPLLVDSHHSWPPATFLRRHGDGWGRRWLPHPASTVLARSHRGAAGATAGSAARLPTTSHRTPARPATGAILRHTRRQLLS